MIDILKWDDLLLALDRQPPKMLLSFDPGETTGFARFERGRLTWSEQLATHTVHDGTPILDTLIGPECKVVVENYQVYKWRAKEHVGDTLHTPRLIGCIETLCSLQGIRPTKQMAQNAKQFVTDEKLKHWGFYVKGKPHERDAIRHGIFYLLFHKELKP